MYEQNITSIVKYHVVPEGKLSQFKLHYLDTESKIEITPYDSLPKIGIKLFEKNLLDDVIKNILLSHTDILFGDILDKYYEMYLKRDISKYPTLNYNINDDPKLLFNLMYNAGNLITVYSRLGPGNIFIVPNEKYVSMLPDSDKLKIIINPTDRHKDKIFVIRVVNDLSSIGLTLFTSRSLNPGRYMKITKLLRKLGRKIDEESFNYILIEVGDNSKTLVQCINLIDS